MTQLLTHVTNTITNGVTTFEAYPFNSFATFQGKYLGAGPSGLFELDDAASVEPVIGTMKTALLHFNSEMQKRCSDFYLAMRSETDITVRVSTDEMAAYDYTLQTMGVERLKQRRVPIGKGLKGKYWDFELECSEQFEYDTMNIAMVLVSRRL